MVRSAIGISIGDGIMRPVRQNIERRQREIACVVDLETVKTSVGHRRPGVIGCRASENKFHRRLLLSATCFGVRSFKFLDLGAVGTLHDLLDPSFALI